MSPQRCSHRDRPRGGFTLVEMLVVIAIIGFLLALLLPATRSSREAARRMSCSNNLKHVGIALHGYHDMYQQFPTAMGGTGGTAPEFGNAQRLSGLVALLPYLEQQALWDEISTVTEIEGVRYPPMGPAPWVTGYPPWRKQIPLLECPSADRSPAELGQTNYTFCIGDMVQDIHAPTQLRGVFGCQLTSRLDDVTDGASNTIAMGEIGTPVGLSIQGQFATGQPVEMLTQPTRCLEVRDRSKQESYDKRVVLGEPGRGGRWADGAAGYSLFNTVLPPNSPSCAVGGREAVDGLYSVGSLHPGGAHVLMVDGYIKFVPDGIDVGQASAPSPVADNSVDSPASPYGVWGSLGTLAGDDLPEVD